MREKAFVSVKAPYFNFNITKSAEFEDIIFDGIDSFSTIEDTKDQSDDQAASRGSRWPIS